MPSSYYQLSTTSLAYNGTMKGVTEVQLTDAFFNDPDAVKTTYVIPLVMTGQTGFAGILEGKLNEGQTGPRTNPEAWDVLPMDYVLYCVKYQNKYSGWWLTHHTTSTADIEHAQTVEIKTLSLNSCAYAVSYQDGDNSSFNTQRLVFAGVKQPELKFFYKLEAGSLVVKGWQPSGDETVFFTAQADGSDEAHWHSAVVNLTLLKQQPFVVVKFLATGQAGKRIFIDDVGIYDGAYTDGIDNSQFTIHNSQFTIEDSQIYDLQGRRVSSSQLRKGLYIINGKKYIKNK